MPKPKSWRFIVFVLRQFTQMGVVQIAGSLTFTTLLALVPVLTVMLVVATALPWFEDMNAQFMSMVNDILVPSGASLVMDYLNQFKNNAHSLTAMGLLGMAVSAILLIQTIDQAFNRIWRVESSRPLWQQMPMYGAWLTLTPVVLGVGASLATQIQAALPHSLGNAMAHISQWCLTCAVLYFAYRVLPHRHVPRCHALCGAVLTASAVEIAKWGFAIYVAHFNSYERIYGVFAAVPVFLIWLHVLWILVLTGAVLTASLSHWREQDAHSS